MILVVSGTSTEVGKTVVTAAIAALAKARDASVAVVKLAQTGVAAEAPGDVDEVRALAGLSPDEVAELHRYEHPLAPAAAARLEGRPPVDVTTALATVRELAASRRLVLVEGAGGLLVRYDDEGTTLADVAHALGAPVVVVAAAGLGTLNHTALTLECLAHRGIELSGVVIGSWPREPDLAARANVRDLETLAARPLAGAVPEGAGALDGATFLACAQASLGPALGGRFDPAAFRTAAESGLPHPLPTDDAAQAHLDPSATAPDKGNS